MTQDSRNEERRGPAAEVPDWVASPVEASPPDLLPAELDRKGGAPGLLAVFRHRNYRLFFAGQLVSLMGTWITTVAQGWLVYSLTHSPLLLGITAFAGQIPVFFLSPFGGMFADRFERRQLMIVTQMLSCMQSSLICVLTLFHWITGWEIVGLALFQGFVNAFDVPARQGMTVEMVGMDDLRPAIALNSMMFNIARVGGPSAAGIIIALVGVGWCFAIDAASYVAVIACLFMMRFQPRSLAPPSHPLHAVMEGFAYVWKTREIRNSLLLIGANSAFGAAYMSMLPAFTRDVLNRGSTELGLLYGAAGAAALAGAYVLAKVPDRHLFAAPVAASFVFGLSLLFFSQARTYGLAVAFLFPAGFSMMLLGGATNSIVQIVARDDMRGRVVAFYAMCALGMMPWGALFLGAAAARLGVSRAILVGGACCVLASILAWHDRRDGSWSVSPRE